MGSLTFRFRLVTDTARRVVNAPQTVTARGVALTLARVVVTRREARFALRFAAPDGGPATAWQPEVSLTGGAAGRYAPGLQPLGGWLNDAATLRGWQPDGSWAGSLLSVTSLLDDPGPWTITVHRLTTGDGIGPHTLIGPWVFHVALPAVTQGP